MATAAVVVAVIKRAHRDGCNDAGRLFACAHAAIAEA